MTKTCPKINFGAGTGKSKSYLRIWNQLLQDTMSANFQAKRTISTFSAQICPKMKFEVEISKIELRIQNHHLQDIMCANFQAKWTTLILWAQVCPKTDLVLEIQKTNFGIRINILEIPYVPIFRQNELLWIFLSKFAQKWN